MIAMKSGAIGALILVIALLVPLSSLGGEVVFVANEDVPVASLDSEDIKDIFTGRKISWENGDKIVFVVQERTDVSESFLQTYVRKNAYDYDIFWKKQVFTGKGQAPQSFSSEKDLLNFVAQTPGAIGYVSFGTDTGNVKTIPVRN
jgi:ABC-type phosphate transport system substrate-binding protein